MRKVNRKEWRNGRETGLGRPGQYGVLLARSNDLNPTPALVWGFFCQALFLRFVVSIWFGLRATTWRTRWGQPQRSEGSPPTGAQHRATNLYAVGPSGPGP